MRQFNWRTAAMAALTSSVFATYSVAQAPANSGGDNKSGNSQSSASNSLSQGQGQASSNNDATGNNKTNNVQGSRDSKSSDQNSSQGQSNPTKENASGQASDSNQRSNSSSLDRSSARHGDDRDSVNSDRDDRSGARSRAERDYDRNDDRTTDNRSSRSDKESSQDRSSRRGKMRGPDIGLWFNRSSHDALVISDVSSRGAIAKAGFHEGDRIVSVNGHRVTREEEFLQYLLHGDARRVKVIVLRDNREETMYVEPAVLTEEYEYTDVDPLERFGVTLDDRYNDRIVVWRVIPRSPAYYAGFRPGDVIVTFGGRPYRSRTDFETGARDWKPGDADVQIRRGDRQRDLTIEIPANDRSDRRRERSEVRSEQTERDSTNSDQRNIDHSDRTTNEQGNSNRGGILNGIGRGRGNR
jgi:C-terminal processing protease CtpA/Prc